MLFITSNSYIPPHFTVITDYSTHYPTNMLYYYFIFTDGKVTYRAYKKLKNKIIIIFVKNTFLFRFVFGPIKAIRIKKKENKKLCENIKNDEESYNPYLCDANLTSIYFPEMYGNNNPTKYKKVLEEVVKNGRGCDGIEDLVNCGIIEKTKRSVNTKDKELYKIKDVYGWFYKT